jgi:CBS domain-containing protein
MEEQMKVSDIMTRNATTAEVSESVREIAEIMAAEDIGFLPVRDGEKLVGTITDRDIVIRALARGDSGEAKVRDVMTKDVKYCFEDEDVDHVIQNMGNIQVRRLPVVDRDKKLVGVVSLADAATKADAEMSGIALSGITEPGGQHSSGEL